MLFLLIFGIIIACIIWKGLLAIGAVVMLGIILIAVLSKYAQEAKSEKAQTVLIVAISIIAGILIAIFIA